MKEIDNTENGFTLLELLISLTIVAVIITIMFSGLRTGISAWEKGEQHIEETRRSRVVLNILKSQLASVCLSNVTYDIREPYFFTGSNKHMSFVSYKAILPGNQDGIFFVNYNVEAVDDNTEVLNIYEKNFILMNKKEGIAVPDEADFIKLISGAANIGFQYLNENKEEEQYEWVDIWPEANERKFPLAVKITLTISKDIPPLSVVASINSEMEN